MLTMAIRSDMSPLQRHSDLFLATHPRQVYISCYINFSGLIVEEVEHVHEAQLIVAY